MLDAQPITLSSSLARSSPHARRGLPLRVGTRGSPLARVQARMFLGLLAQFCPVLAPGFNNDEVFQEHVIRTTGDAVQDRALAEIGGKGLFSKEIHEALADRRIDFAVHSLKDLETELPPGIVLACTLKREDSRDALILGPGAIKADPTEAFSMLPANAVIGTTSLRRQAQLLHARPDLSITLMRGNVQTRIDKVMAGDCAASLLAVAGLRRLKIETPYIPIDPEAMVPSACQGIVGVTVRAEDVTLRQLLSGIEDPKPAPSRPPSAPCSPRSMAPAAPRSAAMPGYCRMAGYISPAWSPALTVVSCSSAACTVCRRIPNASAPRSATNSAPTRRAISLLDPARRGVLITRPAADAAETATLVIARGFDPVIAPVMILHQRSIAPHGRFDAVVTTSRNAIPALPDTFKHLPLLAVGSATATRARHAGFAIVHDAQGDAAALAGLARRRLDPGSRVLFAHGFRQGDALADALMACGFGVTRACAYEVTAARRLPPAAITALEAATLGAALFLSTETAAAFVRLVPTRLHPALAGVAALTIGQRAAEVLAPLPWRDIRVSLKPTLDEVLALL